MNRSDVQAWLDRYVEAWRGNAPEAVAALFTDEATYRYRPYADPAQTVVGNAAIAASWLVTRSWRVTSPAAPSASTRRSGGRPCRPAERRGIRTRAAGAV